MENLKAVFYDMDGTLVYFNIDFERARWNAIGVLEKNGIPKGLYSIETSIRFTVNSAKKHMKEELSYSEERIVEIINEVNEAVVNVEREAAQDAKPVSGIKELLEFVKKNDLKQIICTFNTQEVAKITLERSGLLDYFDIIIGRDDVKKPKPDGFHMQVAADSFGLNPDECIMIGDHSVDLEMARNFGSESIGIERKGRYDLVKEATYIVKQTEIPDSIIKIIKEKI